MAFVEIRNLVRHYSGNFKLYNISLELERGETLTLMGPSGSGKTSLLRNVCGLDIPDSGRITVGGRDITYLPTTKRNIGLIFQDLAIFPHMKVYDNIAYGLRAKNVHERDIEERVEELSGMLGIKSLLERFPGQISGGQRQRVALARSVAPSPSVLLLDEPMSSLDMQLRSSVRSEIKSFAKKMELTMIYVTHDHNEGLYMADKTGIMYDGSIERIAPPQDLFTHPGTERTAKFFGYNVVTADGRKVAFYPSDFKVAAEGPEMSGKIVSIGFEGEHDRAHVMMDSGDLVQLEFPPGKYIGKLAPGDRIGITITRTEDLTG